jgi:hypothetical protein
VYPLGAGIALGIGAHTLVLRLLTFVPVLERFRLRQ